MPHRRPLSSFAWVLLTQIPLAFSTLSSSQLDAHKDDLCGMYLAESTIPGAGMGVFAGHRHIAKGEYLLEDDGDIVVPVYEMTKHVGHTKYQFLWEEYTWKASSFDGMNEEVDDVKKVKACSTGLGAAINCMLPLVNLVDDRNKRQVKLSGIEFDMNYENNNATNLFPISVSSPGVGAFSPYHNRRWKAKVDIVAGMELYGNYGEGYFKTRSAYNKIPLKNNFKEINNLLRKYQRITGGRGSTVTDAQKKELLIYLQGLREIWDESRTMHAIPQTNPKGDHAVVDWLLDQKGGSGMIHYNASIRDLDWLEKHGRCMDNIRDGISKIPHAGRGAFARRKLSQGSIVAPVPLIHIPNRDVFIIYDQKVDSNDDGEEFVLVANHDKPIHQQLLLNYCFGHGESSLLLCPYGLMTSHINHDGTNPNAKIVWAADNQMAHPEWQRKPIDKWGRKAKAGLSFDLVALRDIEPDEEITIHYGQEWEEAWESHVRAYYDFEDKKEKLIMHHVPAFELNDLVDLRLQSMDEMNYETQGLRLFCRRPYLEWHGIDGSVLDEKDGKILVRDRQAKTKTRRLKRRKHTDWNNHEVYPCRILHRYSPLQSKPENVKDPNVNSDVYVVEVFERSDAIQANGSSISEDQNSKTTQDFVWAVLFGVPRDAFYFEDEKKQRHHHRSWSFRHDMRIPDDIFPEVWKNKKHEVQ